LYILYLYTVSNKVHQTFGWEKSWRFYVKSLGFNVWGLQYEVLVIHEI